MKIGYQLVRGLNAQVTRGTVASAATTAAATAKSRGARDCGRLELVQVDGYCVETLGA